MAVDDKYWVLGYKSAWSSLLIECCKRLGVDDPEVQKVAWILERQDIVVTLREVCHVFGDNDWPDDLHLGDVIDKHLYQYLLEIREQIRALSTELESYNEEKSLRDQKRSLQILQIQAMASKLDETMKTLEKAHEIMQRRHTQGLPDRKSSA